MGVKFPAGEMMGLFLFAIASRTALGLIYPPIQWVPGVITTRVKRAVFEADHSPPYGTEVKITWSYISIPIIRLHGVVLS